jgi:serpin B
MDSTLVDVWLPRFETSTDIDLKPIMQKLGMPDAFDRVKANFSRFCNVEVYISLMKQVAKVKLDEEGTEAAAVTVIGVNEKAAGPGPEYVTFRANHPFLYVISEKQTGAVLFIGQYTGY